MTDDPTSQPDEDEEPDVPTDPVPIHPDDPKPEPGSGEDDGSTTEPEA